jgi:hypothetical protein
MHTNQGPQRAGTAVPVLKCFPLRPAAFLYMRSQGQAGATARVLTGESGLFVSDLRAAAFLAFPVAIAYLLGFRATQRIVQFSDRTFQPGRRPTSADANGLKRAPANRGGNFFPGRR